MKTVLKTRGFALLILVCGILMGISATHFYHRYKSRLRGGEHGARQSRERTPEHFTRRIVKRYNLNEPQQAQLTEAFSAFLANNQKNHKEMMPHLQANREALEAQLKNILSPADFADWQNEKAKKINRREPR